MPDLGTAADLLIAQRGIPPTAENKQRAMNILAANPQIANQLYWGTGKSSLPDEMYLGDDFGAPTTMDANAEAAEPTGKGATEAAQAVPPPTSLTEPSQTSQQQMGDNGVGSPNAIPLIPPAAVLAARAGQAQTARGSVDEGIMLDMLTGPNSTEQAIMSQIDAAEQPRTAPGVQQVGDTTFQPTGKAGVVRDTSNGALYRVVGEGKVLDAANNVVDPETTQRILRAVRGLF